MLNVLCVDTEIFAEQIKEVSIQFRSLRERVGAKNYSGSRKYSC